MGTRQFLTLAELEEIVNDPNFFEDDDLDAEIDIVALPPDNVDVISDAEDIDEDVLEDTYPKDVPGRLEVHSSSIRVVSKSTQQYDENAPPLKCHKTYKTQSVQKKQFQIGKTHDLIIHVKLVKTSTFACQLGNM